MTNKWSQMTSQLSQITPKCFQWTPKDFQIASMDLKMVPVHNTYTKPVVGTYVIPWNIQYLVIQMKFWYLVIELLILI